MYDDDPTQSPPLPPLPRPHAPTPSTMHHSVLTAYTHAHPHAPPPSHLRNPAEPMYGYHEADASWAPPLSGYGNPSRGYAPPPPPRPSTGWPHVETKSDGERCPPPSYGVAQASQSHGAYGGQMPHAAPSRGYVSPHGQQYGILDAQPQIKQEIADEDHPISWPPTPASFDPDAYPVAAATASTSGHHYHADLHHDVVESNVAQTTAPYYGQANYVKSESPYVTPSTLPQDDLPMHDADPNPSQESYAYFWDPSNQYQDSTQQYANDEYAPDSTAQYVPEGDAYPDYPNYDAYTDTPMAMADEAPTNYLYERPVIQNSRSYTLAAAITPVSPTQRSSQIPAPRPIMDHLPVPPPEEAPAHTSEAQPPPPPPPPHERDSVSPRRTRGRPRKHATPSSPRPWSPPPPVDYPFPKFDSPELASPEAFSPAQEFEPAPPSQQQQQQPPHVHVPMSLDEVPFPDAEERPGQAMFKLTPPGVAKEPAKKKPIMACLFCRERKIACGPPVPGSPETRCNQCARRGLDCVYPKESRRGQHKRTPRGARATKVPVVLVQAAVSSAASGAGISGSFEASLTSVPDAARVGVGLSMSSLASALFIPSDASGSSPGSHAGLVSAAGAVAHPKQRAGKERTSPVMESRLAALERKTVQRVHQRKTAAGASVPAPLGLPGIP